MIFVGGGAAGASPLVRELAERLGAPVVAGWMGQGVMDGRSPLSISLTMAHRLWPEVDVALVGRLALPARPDGLGPGRQRSR